MNVPGALVSLARFAGDPQRGLCLLAEGNVSCSTGFDNFWIKASGKQMCDAGDDAFCEVAIAPLISALDRGDLDEHSTRQLLNESTVAPGSKSVPSTESFMHALLLAEANADYVIHTHPIPVLKILCLEDAEKYAACRMFPDEIVYCGPATCYVPYVAPGLPLAREIRKGLSGYSRKYGEMPRTIWLQNHGLIGLGKTDSLARAATEVSVKAAEILSGLLATGKSPRFLTSEEIAQIHSWPDEHYRRNMP